MPASPKVAALLVENNRRLLDAARALSIPVIHCVTTYRDVEEIRANPFWRTRAEDPNATRKNVLRHNLAGSRGCTIMPGLSASDGFRCRDEEALRLLPGHGPGHHASHARHQHALGHRHKHEQLRAGDRLRGERARLCGCGHRGLREHDGLAGPSRCCPHVHPHGFRVCGDFSRSAGTGPFVDDEPPDLRDRDHDKSDYTQGPGVILGHRGPPQANPPRRCSRDRLDHRQLGGLGHLAANGPPSYPCSHRSSALARRAELELARVRHEGRCLALLRSVPPARPSSDALDQRTGLRGL